MGIGGVCERPNSGTPSRIIGVCGVEVVKEIAAPAERRVATEPHD